LLLDVLGAKEALSSELQRFESAQTKDNWASTQESLKMVLDAATTASYRMNGAFSGTAFAKTEAYAKLKSGLEGRRYFTLCNIASDMPSTADDLATLQDLHDRLRKQILAMKEVDQLIVRFLK